MGQYYKACIISDKKKRKTNEYGVTMSPECSGMAMNPFAYGGTFKLMEWGYIGDHFCDTVCSQFVRPLNDWRVKLLAFVGDYSELDNHVHVHDSLREYRWEISAVHEAVWNKYGEKALEKKGLERTINLSEEDGWYAVDRTIEEYVKLFDLPNADKDWDAKINPLAVLCATSNGLGGGDYCGVNEDMAGRWAFHDIVITKELPEGYELISPGFTERKG